MNTDDNLEPMIDKELEVEPVPSEASVVAEAGPFEIDVQAWDSVTYAFAHNRVPVIRNLAIGLREGESQRQSLKVNVSLTWSREATPPAKPVSFTLACPPAGGELVRVRNANLALDDTVLVDLEEAVPARLTIEVEADDGTVQVAEKDLRVLARNQWFFRSDYGELIAAFVQPNHPEVRDVLKKASELLGAETGSTSLEGYQSGPERAVQIGKAVYRALQAYGLNYVNPPASFEQGQKVRPLDEVLESKAGTCIDLACAYASALEQAGLHPLVWIVDGHAFAGFLTEETDIGTNVERSVNSILNLTDSGLAVAVETVDLTKSTDFDQSVSSTRQRLLPSENVVRGLVDIYRSHRSGTLPLPARVVRGDVVTIVVDPGPGKSAVVERRDRDSGKVLPKTVPARISRWKSELLDLSFRNRLLRLPSFAPGTRSAHGLELLTAPGLLGEIEDRLSNGGSVLVHPADRLEGVESAAGHRMASELGADVLRGYYEKLGLLYATVGEDEGTRRLRRLQSRARVEESESGANNLYLALGTLVWQSKTDAKENRSPLFLLPVRLQRVKGTALARVVMDESSETTPNYCLVERLKGEFRIDVPELENPVDDGSGVDVELGLKRLRRAIVDAGLSFRVDDSVHLALLNFSTFRLWKDMDEHWETFLERPFVRHLVESRGTPFYGEESDRDQIDLTEAELGSYLPIPADGSQMRAIKRASMGHSFVIEGPPGTGKSQTITNLVANSMALGQKVLFVAEKQAALSVVKERLAAVGLDPFCLDIHGKGAKPDDIRQKLRDALEQGASSNHDDITLLDNRLKGLHRRLSQYREDLYAENAVGLSYAAAHQRQLRLGEGPAAPVPLDFVRRRAREVDALRSRLSELSTAVHAAQPSPEHPWAFVSAADFASLDRDALANVLTELKGSVEPLKNVGEPLASLLGTVSGSEGLRAVALLIQELQGGTLPSPADINVAASEEWPERFSEALQRASEAAERAAPSVSRFGALPLRSEDFEAKLEALETAARSFFIGRGGRVRVAWQALTGEALAGKAKARELVDAAHTLRSHRGNLEVATRQLVEAGGTGIDASYKTYDPNELDRLKRRAARFRTVARLLSRLDALGEAARSLMATGPLGLPIGVGVQLEAAAKVVREFERCLGLDGDADAWAAGGGIVAYLSGRLPAWTTDASGGRFLRLQRWMEVRRHLSAFRAADLNEFAEVILAGDISADDVELAFERGVSIASAKEREQERGLDLFDRTSHELAISEFVEAYDRKRHEVTKLVPSLLVGGRSFNGRAQHGVVGELRLELNKRRNARSIRGLMSRYGELIQQLTPCLLMSPDSVARFLDPNAVSFDLVVFDEASQIEVAEAVGAMGRANSVIIVGDSKQMPPTRVAVSRGFDEEELGFDPDDEADAALLEDDDSLLSEALSAGLEQEWLSWHYRSRDESLIAFSNSNYYEGRLSSFPNPESATTRSLRYRRVQGQFEHGGKGSSGSGPKRTNRIEAEAVVAEVLTRAADPERRHESIGIVTMNQEQRELIENLLREKGDAELAERLESEDLFVRNLENVQGHEKDVIFISTGFSKRADGSPMPLNFGPLTRRGGERRLNVAVTRAKSELVVFSSFDPEEIDLNRTNSLGMHHLRAFLVAARDGFKEAVDPQRDDQAASAYLEEVRDALVARGLEVETELGLSPFRVDLAVRRPGDAAWRVAVLLDGWRWRQRATVGDREGLPTNVLQGMMGWSKVVRVWLPAWRAEQEALLDEIVEAVDAAKAGAGPEAARARRGQVAPSVPEEGTSASAGSSSSVSDGFPMPAQNSSRPGGPAPVFASAGATAAARPALTPLPIVHEPYGPNAKEFVPYEPKEGRGPQEACEPPTVSRLLATSVAEVLASEWPIEAGRLAKLVSVEFGIKRLASQRLEFIVGAARAFMQESSLGRYFWPLNVDPAKHEEFRFSPHASVRTIEQIPPEEAIAAMRYFAESSMGADREELMRLTAGAFGFQTFTSPVRDRMNTVVDHAMATGRLAVDGHGRLIVPRNGAR